MPLIQVGREEYEEVHELKHHLAVLCSIMQQIRESSRKTFLNFSVSISHPGFWMNIILTSILIICLNGRVYLI